MFQRIPNLEFESKTSYPTWLTQKPKKRARLEFNEANDDEEEEDVNFIVNSSQSSWKNEDFVSFADDENENARYAKHKKHDIYNEFLSERGGFMICMKSRHFEEYITL
jgi:hypothetical protein